jgi:hypothetical protein
VIVLLILASVADGLLAVLLIAVSGFVFGGGPEGGHGDPSEVAIWSAGLILCIAAPIAGFVLRSFGRTGGGLVVAWLPPIGALLISLGVFDPSY